MKSANQLFQLFRSTRLATLLCSALITSCGGSVITAGIGGTGISYGTVTDFGSIILNGSRLDDSTAIVTLDGIPGDGSEHGGIKLGMVVKISGTFSGNTGTATLIDYRDNLEGEVCDALLSVNGIRTLRVLGQTVILDATTIVENATIDTISLGDIVEVSGLPDKDGQIHASFVEVKNPAPMEFEVKGFVNNVTGSILTINSLEVDFSGSGVVDSSIPGGDPDGLFVEVKGNSTDFACGAPDTLIATSVELEVEGAGVIPTGDHAEVEGFVTAVTTPVISNSFMIGNQEVVITSSTRFLPEDFGVIHIDVDAKVEADGTFANGVLTATKISFRENVKLESDVATVNGISFTLVGLPGIVITTNSATEFNIVTINSGDHIRVRGIEGPNNTVLATRIDDRSGQTDAFLQGAVDDISDPNITVLGISVDTSSPIFQFEDVNDVPISRATFLDLVQPGTLVKFKSKLAASTIIWDEAELEDD
jgi:hypothetical protein